MGKRSYRLPENYQYQDYTVIKVLGEGGFGIVYHAKDNKLGRDLAIKEYYPHSSVSREYNYNVEARVNCEENYQEGLEKFIAEARVLASCEHPNIVKVHSIIETNNTAYIVMPYYQGITLDKHIKNGPLSEEIAYKYLKPICEALAYLHQKEYIHRDVKPGNIFLRQRGDNVEPILLDFGGARQFNAEATGLFSRVLTAGYAPPEQYLKQSKQAAYTDIYALAGTFYHIISGDLPPTAIDRQLAQKYANSEEADLDLKLGNFSNGFAKILKKAMALDVNERYQSMSEFIGGCQQVFEANTNKPEKFNEQEVTFREKLVKEKRKRLKAEQEAKKAQQETKKIREAVQYTKNSTSKKSFKGFIGALLVLLGVVSVAVVFNDLSNSKLPINKEPVERTFTANSVTTIMLQVPAGEFKMGSKYRGSDEAPHSQSFDDEFWIDKTEVTRGAYEVCVAAGECTSTRNNKYSTMSDQPINKVTWYQAATYCNWREAKLPTEIEWEYAARGPDRRIYPWGNKFDKNKLHSRASGNKTAPIGSYIDGQSWIGALDMAGNVQEWTSSLHRDYPYDKDDGRELIGNAVNKIKGKEKVVLRGGSFKNKAGDLRATARSKQFADYESNFVGFRCVSK